MLENRKGSPKKLSHHNSYQHRREPGVMKINNGSFFIQQMSQKLVQWRTTTRPYHRNIKYNSIYNMAFSLSHYTVSQITYLQISIQ